ncbi:Protein of unknown function [Verrucomicrobium sp. GAS474]|uniref:DUF3311 domain-containing protein n=1 Tax=Verrucomicrobium sp. GAS474 TaxID=1882831 RepID=UPI000879A6C4|nr:DUF3311 domain-containing protein [Verrucomicrobium sp. GAS474]SDT88226.1 Protein of unknown function [Verrucomicrobium sp. GAS474]
MKPLHLLLLIPCLAILWVSSYNLDAPRLLGFPFFYWSQLVWIPITSLAIYLYDRNAK